MTKSKFSAIAASAALVAALGLGACGGQATSSSASADSSSSTSSAAEASSSSSSNAQAAEETVVSWQGALVDGTLVDYISSDDGKHGGLVLTPPNATATDSTEVQRWLGEMSTADGKVTITDDTTKATISFTLGGVTEDGAVLIDVDGYGKGALVPMTAADWKRAAEAEELAATLNTTVNWIGVFENGSAVFYMNNEDGTEGLLAIVPKDSTEMKTWMGAVATEGDTVTITDSKTNEAISFTCTQNAEDGTLIVNSDVYGKGVLVQMTVADHLALAEIAKS